MIYKRKEYAIPQGNGGTLHKVLIQSTPCSFDGQDADLVKAEFFKQINQNPSLIHCAGHPFETLEMYYNHDHWELVVTAIVEKQS